MKYVRNGQIVWPYCENCGRRLDYTKVSNLLAFNHFIHTLEVACVDTWETWWVEIGEKPAIARIIGL